LEIAATAGAIIDPAMSAPACGRVGAVAMTGLTKVVAGTVVATKARVVQPCGDPAKAGSCPPCGGRTRPAILEWCPRPDSNRHSFQNRILNPARLPIPPLGQRDSPITALPRHATAKANYAAYFVDFIAFVQSATDMGRALRTLPSVMCSRAILTGNGTRGTLGSVVETGASWRRRHNVPCPNRAQSLRRQRASPLWLSIDDCDMPNRLSIPSSGCSDAGKR
jgi:hypothetical protein